MSFLKDDTPKIDATTWLDTITSEWPDGSLALNIIQNQSKSQFINHLNAANNWNWFRILMLSKISFKMEWLEEIIKTGLPIDKPWIAMDTGKQITIFDINDTIDGGFNENVKHLFEDIFIVYETLFLKKQIQPIIDIFTDYSEDNKWSELTILLMTHVYGPLNEIRPLYHYMVLMDRYDILRVFLTGATTLHKAIKKKHTNINFQKSWVNLRGHGGGTILHMVCGQNKPTWINYFLSVDADPLIKDFDDMTPFHIKTNETKISSLYNSLNGEMQQRWNENNMHYFLLYAIQKDDHKLLDWLLVKGGDPNTDDLVLICLKNDYVDCLKVLIKHGADPNHIKSINISLVETYIHLDSGGVLFKNNIIGLLHGKYNPTELCIISTIYNTRLIENEKKDIVCKYLGMIENKAVILEFFTKILNIKTVTEVSRKIQQNVKNVIHMCE